MGKPTHEQWVKRQKQKRQEDTKMELGTEMSDLRDLEAAIEESSSSDDLAPMDVDKPHNFVPPSLKVQKTTEKASVRKQREKKTAQTVKYSERLEARMLKQTKKTGRGKKK